MFDNQCDNTGIPCPEGLSCFCRPCVKAFEVDLVHWDAAKKDDGGDVDVEGCEKMSVCGTIQQKKTITFRAIDNRKRNNATLSAFVYIGQQSYYLNVTKVAPFEYEFSFSDSNRGTAILEVYVDDVQIPESPFRVDIVPRDCPEGMIPVRTKLHGRL